MVGANLLLNAGPGAFIVDDLQFLRARTDGAVKIMLPGPFTMSQQAFDEAYNEAALALDFSGHTPMVVKKVVRRIAELTESPVTKIKNE